MKPNYLPRDGVLSIFSILSVGYEYKIEECQRTILRKTIFSLTHSAYHLYRKLWPEAKHGFLSDKNYKGMYRFFLWLSLSSYPVAVWMFHHCFAIQQNFKKVFSR